MKQRAETQPNKISEESFKNSDDKFVYLISGRLGNMFGIPLSPIPKGVPQVLHDMNVIGYDVIYDAI